MRVDSNAKINLGLKVLGKRADGFHDLLSVFQEVDFGDEMSIEAVDGTLDVTCRGQRAPDGRDNLAYRAANELRKACKNNGLGARIHIDKAIPLGGGLGGGSSNAAQALLVLNSLWELNFESNRLRQIAEGVGSDVPFFVSGGTAVVTGRGEHVQPIDFSGNLALVLVFPGFSVPTPWAFSNLNTTLTSETPYIRFLNSVPGPVKVDLLELFPLLENDFLPLVSARYPSIERILAVLRSEGALGVTMSGTGATLVGGFLHEADAHSAADDLQDQGYETRVCRPVRRERQQDR